VVLHSFFQHNVHPSPSLAVYLSLASPSFPRLHAVWPESRKAAELFEALIDVEVGIGRHSEDHGDTRVYCFDVQEGLRMDEVVSGERSA
jgi:hypothetical protein